ncbi:MAG: type III pantothenate kinase [Betaproteobacteria bacterium]|nr:type III pantothenate kinase [Betaproteobacteria bacterium]
MTLLAIDAGNTNVKWALHDGAAWHGHGSALTAAVRAQGLAIEVDGVQRIVASNVAGQEVAGALTRLASRLNAPLTIIASRAAQCGVTSGYLDPCQLGTDRWAALIGARAMQTGECAIMVVLAGTALTVDALDATGQHLGGIILPGTALMHTSLARGTAQLPHGEGAAPAFPASTVEAISRGIADAQTGAVERFHRRAIERCGQDMAAVGAGGGIRALVPNLPFPVAIHDNLIFNGLAEIAREADGTIDPH